MSIPIHEITDRVERPMMELLVDVNATSGAARNAWLFFLALLTYFLIALAGVSHKDLLLESAIELPLLQVKIPQRSMFLFGPLILVLVHFGLLLQHVMLARKLRDFHARVTHHEGLAWLTDQSGIALTLINRTSPVCLHVTLLISTT